MDKRTLTLYFLCGCIISLLFVSISHQHFYEYIPLPNANCSGSSKLKISQASTESKLPSLTVYNNSNLYVISLQDVPGADSHNAERLVTFQREWAKLCGPEFTFQFCPGVLDERRGFGLTRSYVDCFERAISDGAANPVFLEDDARLFNANFCQGMDWAHLPKDTFVALLGERDGLGLDEYQQQANDFGGTENQQTWHLLERDSLFILFFLKFS